MRVLSACWMSSLRCISNSSAGIRSLSSGESCFMCYSIISFTMPSTSHSRTAYCPTRARIAAPTQGVISPVGTGRLPSAGRLPRRRRRARRRAATTAPDQRADGLRPGARAWASAARHRGRRCRPTEPVPNTTRPCPTPQPPRFREEPRPTLILMHASHRQIPLLVAISIRGEGSGEWGVESTKY